MKQKLFFIFFLFIAQAILGGNPDRVGQAGATELLINPWARSSGWGGLNVASVKGLEAMNVNIAGLAFTKKTEVAFARTIWLKGSEIFINTAGIAQKIGKTGVMAMSVISQDFGDISTTTTNIPDGGIGTYSPQFVNIGIAYSKEFSNSIYGGILFRGISEGLSDAKAFGISLDAGIQYVAGKTDNLRFGITVKNVGPPMRYSGDGLSIRSNDPAGKSNQLTVNQRAEKFELPSQFKIGMSYDLKIKELHRLSIVGNYTSNSFFSNQLGAGVEYSFREYLMVRAAYNYEKGLFDAEKRINALTGFSTGFTFEVPLKKGRTVLGIDYSYRSSNPFEGTHCIGAKISL